ncbi:MAG TPA: malto-oligosyltrehalose trehalohydrolase [Longimicrobiales bacterium]
MRLGATAKDGQQTEFVVWAPHCREVAIEIVEPARQRVELSPGEHNYFTGIAPVGPGARYFVIADQGEGRPDPASRFQPDGVHGASEVSDPSFDWQDRAWRGLPLQDYIIYELHIGTFSDAGTFDGALQHLDELHDLGVTAIEIMPIAQFPGERNWGYDGVLPFAVQNSYGGPAGLKRLVDACHARGLAVILDVVYNHLGPEGNYLGEFGPYFTTKYQTPWGPAVNVDDAHSDEVRRFFIDNALEWITDYHIDALRLDAVHGILDTSATPFLCELSAAVARRAVELARHVYLIAESDLNDVRMITPLDRRGLGMHAQWTDDFHHSLHALLTRERSGYYADYGTVAHLAESLRRGYVYRGQFSPYRLRRHGNEPAGATDEQFVVCMQNHDQIGNRMNGDRMAALTSFERQKVGAAVLLLSPFVPLLFQGEEYAETRPFPYFIDHSDHRLVSAVRKGRRAEFASFAWQAEPPDPAGAATFDSARMRRPPGETHEAMRNFYRHLLVLRKELRLAHGAQRSRTVHTYDDAEVITITTDDIFMLFVFAEEPVTVSVAMPAGVWRKRISTSSPCWRGPGDAAPDELRSAGSAGFKLPGAIGLLYTRAG